MKSEIRWCPDIGLYVLDRSKDSCVYKTEFCTKNCYNNKMYKIFKHMTTKDVRNEAYWASLTPKEFARGLRFKHHSIARFRFCARGEPFDDMSHVIKIRDIVASFPNIMFKIPTRAWRNPAMKAGIQQHIMDKYPNVRIIASIDPSNTEDELKIAHEWRTFFFGDDTTHPYENEYLFGESSIVKCPKTWEKRKGYCEFCTIGCFNKEIKDIWLKQH
jgi:hypothetical protein